MTRKAVIPALPGLLLTVLMVACGPKTANLRIDMADFMYSPDHWSVPAGAQVTVTLNNKGALDHTWIILKKGVVATTPFGTDQQSNILWQAKVTTGQNQTFEFTAPADPGDYEVICGVPAHLEQGMKGTLTVTP